MLAPVSCALAGTSGFAPAVNRGIQALASAIGWPFWNNDVTLAPDVVVDAAERARSAGVSGMFGLPPEKSCPPEILRYSTGAFDEVFRGAPVRLAVAARANRIPPCGTGRVSSVWLR